MSYLKNQLIKLAYEKPELRNDLLPIIKKAEDTFKCSECGTKVLEKTGYCVKCKKKVKKAKSFDEAIKDKKFKHPETGNDVKFESLPSDEQKKVRKEWKEKNKGDDGKKDKGKGDSKSTDSIQKALDEMSDPDSGQLDDYRTDFKTDVKKDLDGIEKWVDKTDKLYGQGHDDAVDKLQSEIINKVEQNKGNVSMLDIKEVSELFDSVLDSGDLSDAESKEIKTYQKALEKSVKDELKERK